MDNGTLVVKDHLREEMQKIFLKRYQELIFSIMQHSMEERL